MSHLPLADLIRMRREARGWSQQKLAAEVSKIEGLKKPLSYATVQHWERGTTAPKRKRMMTVAHLLGISPNEMVSASADRLPSSASEQADALPSLEEGIRILASTLERAHAGKRELASTLLAGLARNPENREFVQMLLVLFGQKGGK